MRPALRLLTLIAAAAALLAVPASGWAANATTGSVGPHPFVSGPAAPAMAFARVPGATALTVGIPDAQPWINSESGGSDLVVGQVGSISYVWSTGGSVVAPLDGPAGSVVWQIDYWGYVREATLQTTWSTCLQAMTGDGIACTSNPATTVGDIAGGLLHGVRSWAEGMPIQTGTRLFVDLDQTLWSFGFVGAVVQYTAPFMQLYPITPARVYDSRFATRIGNGEKRTVSVKDAIDPSTGAVSTYDVVPQGARGINFTITLSQTVGAGNVAVLPGGNTTVTASTINWTSAGLDIAAGSTVTLGTGSNERKITLALGGSAGASGHVIIDITGYYL